MENDNVQVLDLETEPLYNIQEDRKRPVRLEA